MTDADGNKYLPVSRLLELLAELPGDTNVQCNKVGNLMITSSNNDYIGFIDFLLDGEIELNDV